MPIASSVWSRRLGSIAAFALAYFAGAELGHFLSTPVERFATLWPPAGLYLAALLLRPRRDWPLLVLAALSANLVSDVACHGKTIVVSLCFWLGNSAEALLSAALVQKLRGTSTAFTRLKDLLVLLTVGAFFSPLLNATLGTTTILLAFGTNDFRTTWQMWWISDVLGVIAVAPLVLLWSQRTNEGPQPVRLARIVECVLLFGGLALTAEWVYGDLGAAHPPRGLIFPFLLWAALRFGLRGTTVALLLLTLCVVWHTSRGRGVFHDNLAWRDAPILAAQMFLTLVGLSTLVLGIVAEERRRAVLAHACAAEALQQALDEIRTLRGLLPICMTCKQIRDDAGQWHRLEAYVTSHTGAQFTHGVCPNCIATLCPAPAAALKHAEPQMPSRNGAAQPEKQPTVTLPA